MDEGSETSFCTFDLAKKLGAKLKSVNIQVCTNNGVSAVNKEIECLYIKGLDEPATFKVNNVLVQESIIDVSSSIPSDSTLKDYLHLRELRFP